jgi:hypothetical protein
MVLVPDSGNCRTQICKDFHTQDASHQSKPEPANKTKKNIINFYGKQETFHLNFYDTMDCLL